VCGPVFRQGGITNQTFEMPQRHDLGIAFLFDSFDGWKRTVTSKIFVERGGGVRTDSKGYY
jgi:hypothetical protein